MTGHERLRMQIQLLEMEVRLIEIGRLMEFNPKHDQRGRFASVGGGGGGAKPQSKAKTKLGIPYTSQGGELQLTGTREYEKVNLPSGWKQLSGEDLHPNGEYEKVAGDRKATISKTRGFATWEVAARYNIKPGETMGQALSQVKQSSHRSFNDAMKHAESFLASGSS